MASASSSGSGSGSSSGGGFMSIVKSKSFMAIAGAAAVAGFGYLAYRYYHRSSSATPAVSAKAPFTHKQLHRFHRVFKRLDRDGNGQLDVHEIRHLAKLLYVPTKQELRETLARFDTNHDSKISFDEFVKRLTTVPAHDAHHTSVTVDLNEHDLAELKRQFDELDTNHDGTLSGDEAVALARDAYVPPQHIVDEILARLDLDRNQSVSLEEFLSFMAQAITSVTSDPAFRSVSAMVVDIETREKRNATAAAKAKAAAEHKGQGPNTPQPASAAAPATK